MRQVALLTNALLINGERRREEKTTSCKCTPKKEEEEEDKEEEEEEEEEEDSAALFVRSASRGHTARGANTLCVGDIIIIIIIARIF